MDYELIRTQRKTVAICIRDCRIIVRAPMRTPVREIDRFVALKRDWIEKHIAAQQARAEQRAGFTLDYGSSVMFLGRHYRIASSNKLRGIVTHPYTAGKLPASSSAAGNFDESSIYFQPGLDETQLRKKLILFYKEQAREVLSSRVFYFAPLMGVKPSDIQIGSAKRSWGVCNSAGRLRFSWRLMMAAPDAVDYVVIHELAHLKQLNHSSAFWALVSRFMPDWKVRRKKLRILQRRLDAEDWG